MKAMILAAGRGERLRPLTDRVPKALIEVGGRTLLDRHLDRLAAAGLREVVINAAHLSERVAAQVAARPDDGLEIALSIEPEALETAGALAYARALLGEAPFLLVNADVYCELDFARLSERALGDDLAHLVLVANPTHRPQGDFSLSGERVGDAAASRYTYAGIAIVSPRLVGTLRSGEKAALGPILHAAAGAGRVSGERYPGPWFDVGTAERLAALEAFLKAESTP